MKNRSLLSSLLFVGVAFLAVACCQTADLKRIHENDIDAKVVVENGKRFMDVTFKEEVAVKKITVTDIKGEFVNKFDLDATPSTTIRVSAEGIDRGMNLVQFEIDGYKDVDALLENK